MGCANRKNPGGPRGAGQRKLRGTWRSWPVGVKYPRFLQVEADGGRRNVRQGARPPRATQTQRLPNPGLGGQASGRTPARAGRSLVLGSQMRLNCRCQRSHRPHDPSDHTVAREQSKGLGPPSAGRCPSGLCPHSPAPAPKAHAAPDPKWTQFHPPPKGRGSCSRPGVPALSLCC